MNLTRAEERELATVATKLDAARSILKGQFTAIQSEIADLERRLKAQVAAYNAALHDAAEFVERVAERLSDEFNEKSDRWKDGDAGQAASSFVDDWRDADLSPIDDVGIIQPELEDDLCHVKTLLELPTESN